MATAKRTRLFKVDFFALILGGELTHTVFADLLSSAGNGVTQAIPLDGNDDEQYQIRSIVKVGRNLYKGVFGRCRFNEMPVQGSASGDEADVELLPGHGLVAKNYFLFYANRNLLLFQRNRSGSHSSRLQRYISTVTSEGVRFEPILTTDAYARLIDGADARILDISFMPPKDPALYEDVFLQEAIALVNGAGGLNARIRISVGRSNRHLATRIKQAVLTIAKAGAARVARVTLEDDSEPIDLIADRIIETIDVDVGENGRPIEDDIYAQLAIAHDARANDLKVFFGR